MAGVDSPQPKDPSTFQDTQGSDAAYSATGGLPDVGTGAPHATHHTAEELAAASSTSSSSASSSNWKTTAWKVFQVASAVVIVGGLIAFSVTALTGQIPNIKPADLNLGEKIGLGLVPVGGLAVGAAIKGGIHLHQKRKAETEPSQREFDQPLSEKAFDVYSEFDKKQQRYFWFYQDDKGKIHKFDNSGEAYATAEQQLLSYVEANPLFEEQQEGVEARRLFYVTSDEWGCRYTDGETLYSFGRALESTVKIDAAHKYLAYIKRKRL